MQLTTLMSSFLLAASAVYAAPSQDLEARQIIPFNIALLSTNSCSNRYSSFFPNNGTACQVLSQPAASVFGTTALPSSCTSKCCQRGYRCVVCCMRADDYCSYCLLQPYV